MTKSEQQKYVGDGQAYLAACYDEKVRQNRMREFTDEEVKAKSATIAAFKAACGFGEKHARPF